VYGFLEDKVGVRWYLPEVFGPGFPENMGTYVPRRASVPVPQGTAKFEPSFLFRTIAQRSGISLARKTFMNGAYSAYPLHPLEATDDPTLAQRLVFAPDTLLLLTHGSEHNHPLQLKNTEPNLNFYRALKNGWPKLYSRFGIYEYYYKAGMNELPFPVLHSIRQDIPFYQSSKVDFFVTQWTADTTGTLLLNHYVAAKLLWNAQADVDAILADFYRNFYGPAKQPMRAYHEGLEQAAAAGGTINQAKLQNARVKAEQIKQYAASVQSLNVIRYPFTAGYAARMLNPDAEVKIFLE
jgi:hypothetical protein